MAESRWDVKTARALGSYLDLIEAAESLDALMGRPLLAARLTLTQFRVLGELWKSGPQERHDLSRKLFRTESNASAVMKVLEKRDWIARRGHESDQRKVMIHLTPAGQELIAKVYPRQARLARAQMAALNGREQVTLRKLCQKLTLGDPLKFVTELRLEED